MTEYPLLFVVRAMREVAWGGGRNARASSSRAADRRV